MTKTRHMNQFNPKKLSNSKWTAVAPRQKEKHFVVAEVTYLENGTIDSLTMEAILSKRTMPIDWQELKRADKWVQGWT